MTFTYSFLMMRIYFFLTLLFYYFDTLNQLIMLICFIILKICLFLIIIAINFLAYTNYLM